MTTIEEASRRKLSNDVMLAFEALVAALQRAALWAMGGSPAGGPTAIHTSCSFKSMTTSGIPTRRGDRRDA